MSIKTLGEFEMGNYLHILDVSNYIYIGNVKGENAIRGVRECDGAYIPNRAPIGGITFLAKHVAKILESGEDVFLAFDRKPVFKQKMYKDVFGFEKEYKGQRKRNNGVFIQKDFAEQLMRATGVPCGAIEDHEADDIIYSVWRKYYDDYNYIRIHTEDSDLAFMVDEKTEILPVKSNGRHITLENYIYQVHTNSLTPYNMALLLKMIGGDQSDNIQGTGDQLAWVEAFKDTCDKYGYNMAEMGNVDRCRDFIIKVVTEHPDLKNAHMALNIYNLVTPCLVNIEDLDEPGNSGNLGMMKDITGIMRPSQRYPELEDILGEYIREYGR